MPYALPLTEGDHSDLKSISCDTLAGLLRGEFDNVISDYQVNISSFILYMNISSFFYSIFCIFEFLDIVLRNFILVSSRPGYVSWVGQT